MKEESLLLLSDLQKLINQVVLIDYIIIILGLDALSKYYSDEQLNQVINVKPKNRITIGYCRISNHKQKDDLERQIDNVRIYLQEKGGRFISDPELRK